MNIPYLPHPDTIGERLRSRGARTVMAAALAGGVAVGGTACGEGQPTPIPDETVVAPTPAKPLCEVIRISSQGRDFTLGIKTSDAFKQSAQRVDSIRYNFPDGSGADLRSTNEHDPIKRHTTYTFKAGRWTVGASVYFEAYPDAPEIGLPDKGNAKITKAPCKTFVATVE